MLGGGDQLFVGGIWITPTEVFGNTAREKGVFLQYHTYALAKVEKGIVLDVDAVDEDLSFVGVVKTGNE